MDVVKTKGKVVSDDSGIESEIPVLLMEGGILEPLLDYVLSHLHDRSESWMNRVVYATELLVRYLEANQDCFDNPRELFQTFAQRLYTGTIGDDGLDPSGLYWLPASTNTTNGLITALTGLTDWLADHRDTQPMNPLRTADSHEQRLQYAAWYRRNQHDFLGHIHHKSIGSTVNKARMIRGRRSTVTVHDDAIAFPERLFPKFFVEGLGGASDRRAVVRNQLILLMMHCAGCRLSDALHLWVHDVFENSSNPNSVSIRLYHPEDGRAPIGWRGRNGATNRAAYLKECHALTPRNRLTGTQRVGWKCTVADHRDNYIQLYWFPPQAGVLFKRLWHEYLRYLIATDRHHPYAFISFEPRTLGQPLTRNAFEDAYTKALLRIGETPAKVEGRSPHGHRHAMGRRLERAGVDPLIRQKVLHHKSLHSQVPYTAPGIERVTRVLDDSTAALQQNAETGETDGTVPEWEELLRYGFEDIDPEGLFSGPGPKLSGG